MSQSKGRISALPALGNGVEIPVRPWVYSIYANSPKNLETAVNETISILLSENIQLAELTFTQPDIHGNYGAFITYMHHFNRFKLA